MRRGAVLQLTVFSMCGLLCLPGAAFAATASVSPTCAVQTTGAPPNVTISGSGFSPQASVVVNRGALPPYFLADGSSFSNVSFQLLHANKNDYTHAPLQWTVSVSEAPIFKVGQTYDPANVITISGLITRRLESVDGVLPRNGKYLLLKRPQFSGKRGWEFSGFEPGQPIYGHVQRGKKVLAHYRFGVATAPCGGLKARAAAIPGIARKKLKKGSYTVVLNNSPTSTARIERVVIPVPRLK